MANFFDRIFGRSSAPKNSGATAKQRLQFVLVHDRINLPPERMELMKQEILAVITRYVQVEGDSIEVELQKRDRTGILVAEVPFLKPLEAPNRDEDDDLVTKRMPPMGDAPAL